MSTRQSNHEKDLVIRKQAKQIEKLQLEVNALKISLSGSSSNNNVTPRSLNEEHQNAFWQRERLFNRTG